MEMVTYGFGEPRNPHILAHGVLHSGWQSFPSMAPSWQLPLLAGTQWGLYFQLCGHCIHEGCLLTLNCQYSMEACPICASRATHFEREGQCLSPLIYLMLILVNLVPFWLSSVFFSTSFHCLWMMVISLPFLNRVSDHHHLSPLERERLASLLAQSPQVKDMP